MGQHCTNSHNSSELQINALANVQQEDQIYFNVLQFCSSNKENNANILQIM